MRKVYLCTWVLAFILMRSQQAISQSIQIKSNFDRGSIGVIKQLKPGVFQGQTNHFIKKDQKGNQYYWFYFKVLNGKNKPISIQLNNMQGIYRGNLHLVYTDYTQPVISTDQKKWQRISDVDYNPSKKEFVFSFTPSADTAWVAYAQPYPYSRLQQMTDTLRNRDQVSIKTIGKSVNGRPISMIQITGNEKITVKRDVVLTSLQHAGEDAGGFFIEGLIKFLLSGSAKATSVLRKVNFYIFPMLNPDGFYYGTSRYNWNMEDLNAEWDYNSTDTTDGKTEPEVSAVKQWVENFQQKKSIDLFLDVHNMTQKNRSNAFLYQDKRVEKFIKINENLWDVEGDMGNFNNSAVYYMNKKYNIPAATIELTQSHTGYGHYLTIQDYYKYGAQLGKAIGSFGP